MDKQAICNMYELNHEATFSLLNDGENQTYLIEVGIDKYVLRQYRPNRYDRKQIQAEIEWVTALKNDLLVPTVITNIEGEWVTALGEFYYVLFNYIEAIEVNEGLKENYYKLGKTMITMHKASTKILEKASVDWLGLNRPIYDEQFTVNEPLMNLLNASFLSKKEKDECTKIAEDLRGLGRKVTTENQQFLHGDLHFGNILDSNSGWYILDFDEMGFGQRAIDIGVPRLHMISSNRIDEMWSSFKAGYNTPLTEEEVRLGTCLRIFYMAGKIPLRTDIEAIGKEPSKFIKRYLNFINQELTGSTPF